MKRLRSSDDLQEYGEKGAVKDWGRREEGSGLQRSSSCLHRGTYYKSSDNGRKVLSSSASRYGRFDDEKESSRLRKRSDYDFENYERRKNYDRHREGNERGILSSSPRAANGTDQMYRAESIPGPRRDFLKGFRSERDRPTREGIAASWRKFANGKDCDDGSRSGNEGSRGSRVESKEIGKAKSPQDAGDVKSPSWTKDSGSERSKSVEGEKRDDTPVESCSPSSEREEGELDPDPQPLVPLTESEEEKDVVLSKSPRKGLNDEDFVEGRVTMDKVGVLSGEEGDTEKVGSTAEQTDHSTEVEGVLERNDNQDSLMQKSVGAKDEIDTNGEKEGENKLLEGRREGCLEEIADNTCDDKLSSLPEPREENAINNEMIADAAVTMEANNLQIPDERELQLMQRTTMKDKGKSVMSLPTSSVHFTEVDMEAEIKPRDLQPSADLDMDGPSTMGFQFLSTEPIRKSDKVEETHNKPKDDKLALELSLSLPNVLLPIGSQNRVAPGSPSHARSVQSFASSFRTNSDGFTASMSFSGSQQFTHNPSCSLTHNALDFEQSVGSKPLFQGVDWKALSADENKGKEVPAYQGMSSRENGVHLRSNLTQRNSSGQGGMQPLRIAGSSSKLPIGLDRQLSFSKNSSGTQGFGSYEIGPEYSKDRRKQVTEKQSGSLRRSNDLDGKEQLPVAGVDFAESIITMVVSEPLNTIARRFTDMTGKHVACVKEFVLDIISNSSKKWQLSALQKALQKRQDLTLDMLLNAHRIQLEILVALKTGLQEYLLPKYDISSPEMAEIFLNMRCKNLSCKSLLPVDECDCKICSKRSDFCRECMCLVCSKFDMASNTCSWVGCDVCLHWCHADCALQESHIRNGCSATGAQGSTEMQFYCVACDHPSEIFGFVKEVFLSFVKEWTEENLSRELEYVRRIFGSSEDIRGKQLHEVAVRMLSKLSGRADLQEVRNHVTNFFSEMDSYRSGTIPVEPRNEFPSRNQEGGKGIAGSIQGTTGWMKPIFPDKTLRVKNSISLLPSFDSNQNDKYTMNLDIQKNAQKEPVFDELESIVRIKQAEAAMFQSRADDAIRESEALKRIAVSKSERIEEEYSSRITKLRLAEAEEMRKQKVEELQALERAYQEYFNMKMRMENDIKDLLLKMEATRRNFPL